MIGVDNQEALLAVKEAAKLLNVSTRAIKAWVSQGRIRFVQLRRQVFFRSEDLWAFFNEQAIEPFIKIGG
jgi:excisionase family DNA binding protein